jgi:hypothetical protein
VDLPERQPILILAGFMPDVSSLDLPYQVRMVPQPSPSKDEVFQVSSVHKGPDRIVVQFKYPIEGLVGRFVLVRRNDDWVIDNREMKEKG